jgi:hypothetical protein
MINVDKSPRLDNILTLELHLQKDLGAAAVFPLLLAPDDDNDGTLPKVIDLLRIGSGEGESSSGMVAKESVAFPVLVEEDPEEDVRGPTPSYAGAVDEGRLDEELLLLLMLLFGLLLLFMVVGFVVEEKLVQSTC